MAAIVVTMPTALRERRQSIARLEAIVISINPLAGAWKRNWVVHYGFAVLVVAVAAELRLFLGEHYGVSPTYLTFYPAAMLVAVVGGLWPGIVATLLSAACADYFLLEPLGRFSAKDAADIIGLAVFVSMGLFISVLAETVRRTRERAQARVERALHDSEEHFRLLVEGAQDHAIFMLDPEGRVVSWNAGAERIKGWSAREIVGQHFSLLFPQETRNNGHPHRQLKLAVAEGSFREEAERVRKDGSRFWASVVVTALHDDKGDLRGYANVTRDITERKRAAQDMTENRSRLASIVGSAMDAIITVDADQRIVLFNAAAETMFRCPVTEALGKPLGKFIPQRFREAHSNHVRSFTATGLTNRAMGQLGTLSGLRRNGEEFPIEVSISQADVDGSKFFTAILRDITERKRSEEHQSLLLRELSHRVKNTLAVVQSIAAQTRLFADPDQFYDTFTARLEALGSAHDLLTKSEWEGAALADVVRLALAPYEGHGIVQRWAMEGPGIWLAPNEAVTLSLVFHELATNAAKFGALSNATGTVDVSWDLDHAELPTAVEMRWLEYGGPTVKSPLHRGFGSRLLDRAVAHELGGETRLDFSSAGVECRLRFPLSPKVKLQS